MNRIGTCDQCGGSVIVPMHSVWPTPHCVDCGAVASVGPVIRMQPGSGRKKVQSNFVPSTPEDEKGGPYYGK